MTAVGEEMAAWQAEMGGKMEADGRWVRRIWLLRGASSLFGGRRALGELLALR